MKSTFRRRRWHSAQAPTYQAPNKTEEYQQQQNYRDNLIYHCKRMNAFSVTHVGPPADPIPQPRSQFRDPHTHLHCHYLVIEIRGVNCESVHGGFDEGWGWRTERDEQQRGLAICTTRRRQSDVSESWPFCRLR